MSERTASAETTDIAAPLNPPTPATPPSMPPPPPASPTPPTPPGAQPPAASFWSILGATARDWCLTEGLTWVYIAKAVTAALLALFIAMRLELPSPRTALTTVFIVMTPQSGMVLAKSFYRILGTVVGLVAMLTMISLFSQAHVLFLCSVAIWIGICTAGSARNRNFRSYGFLLAGYTAALIGVSNAEAPLGAFDAAVTRVIEISLGIVCSAVVSAVVFPRYSSSLLKTQARTRFSSFVDFVRDGIGGKIDRAAMERRNMGFIADVVGFEALRSYSIFEDPLSRLSSGRLGRLNSESMAVSTRFHALHQLLGRLRAQQPDAPGYAEANAVVTAITPYLHELAEQLTLGGKPVVEAADAARVSAQLAHYRQTLPGRLDQAREALPWSTVRRSEEGSGSGSGSLDKAGHENSVAPQEQREKQRDFDTACELLQRFAAELERYTATYASLETPHVGASEKKAAKTAKAAAEDQWKRTYAPKTNGWMAANAGARAAITFLLTAAFWIFSDWPSGDFAALTAGTVCALISASPRPARAAIQMGIGATLGAVAGYIVTFHVFVYRDGFAEMASGLLPFLMFGAWLVTRRQWVGAGLGYCIFFCFLAGPDNVNVYEPAIYINNSAALVTAMVISAVAFGVLMPPTSGWFLRRMAGDLRRQVGFAAFGKRHALAHRFDNQTRDFMHQIAALTAENPTLQREMLSWMFAVLEVGHALIELRQEFALLPEALRADPRYAQVSVWRESMRTLRKGLDALFAEPSTMGWQAAMDATQQATQRTQAVLQTVWLRNPDGQTPQDDADRLEAQRLHRILSYLHFIRTALLDKRSPLAAYALDSWDGDHPEGRDGDTPALRSSLSDTGTAPLSPTAR